MDKWERDFEERLALEDVFHGTCDACATDPELMDAVQQSKERQEIIIGEEPVRLDFKPKGNQHVIVSRKKTLEAARAYKDKHVAVLNFASAVSPGGGTINKGGLTQEECLCRETTVYPCISSEECLERFYKPHRGLNEYSCSDMIYTPDVVVIRKQDNTLGMLLVTDRFYVDVITMAAPNLSRAKPAVKISDEVIGLLEDRFTRIMSKAAEHGVQALILGAFGCGAFGNNPMAVATAAARALDKFPEVFDVVEFAIYDPSSRKNFHTFRMVLDRYLNKSQAGE